jgi:hypothetical protein
VSQGDSDSITGANCSELEIQQCTPSMGVVVQDDISDSSLLSLCDNTTDFDEDEIEIKSKDKSKSTDRTTTDIENVTKGSVKLVFINSYWTDNTILGGVDAGVASEETTAQALDPVQRVEVGPGEGDSVLAVVLVNKGFTDLTSIIAELDLPAGFQSIVSPTNKDSSKVFARYDGQIDPGRTFILNFPVKILQDAKVGKEYTANLKIQYLKETDEKRGKAKIERTDKDKSKSELEGICSDDDSNTNKSKSKSNTDRFIKAKTVHTPFNSKDQTIKVPIKISGKVILDVIGFSGAEGNGSSTGSSYDGNGGIVPSSSNTVNVLSTIPGIGNRINLIINNEGSAAATGVIATVSGRVEAATNNNLITPETSGNVSRNVVQQSTVIPVILLGGTVFNIGSIPGQQDKEIDTVVFPNTLAAGTLETLNVQLQYNDAYGNRKVINELVGIQILPLSPQSELSVTAVPSS